MEQEETSKGGENGGRIPSASSDTKPELTAATSEASMDTKLEIVGKLTAAGLDGEYWADVLKSELSITKIDQTKHIEADDLKKLKAKVQHNWEANALRKLFGISEDECKAQLTKLHEQARALLDDAAKINKKGVDHIDEMTKGKLDQVRQLMNVSKEQWVEKFENKSLDDMIDKIKSDLKDLGRLAEGKSVNSPSEVLANASAGLALRGVLVGKTLNEGCEILMDESFGSVCPKRTVLSPPTKDMKLTSPFMSQIDDVVHFSSKQHSDQFHRSLDAMGYSFVAAGHIGKSWLNIDGRRSGKHDKKVEKESESHSDAYFESRVSYSVVPTAACELEPCSLKLSDQALRELKNIDKLLIGSESQGIVDEKCEEFLETYGSHVNCGTLHFGGVNKFIATYSSDASSKSEKTKDMLQDAISAYASAGLSGICYSGSGSICADDIKTDGRLKTEYERSELARTSLHTTRSGGPQEASTLPLWKMGLVTCSSNWALIDRGRVLSTDFVEIWKLIPNHEGEFQAPEELASSLSLVWEKRNGSPKSTDQENEISKALRAMDDVIAKIVTWNSQQVVPENCTAHLQEIIKVVEQVNTKTGTNKYWEHSLRTKLDISDFLRKIVGLKGNFSANDVSTIRYIMKNLISTTEGLDFPGKQEIMSWIKAKAVNVPFSLTAAVVKSIPDLVSIVKELCVPAPETELATSTYENAQQCGSIDANAAAELAFCTKQLLADLESSERLHELFFLRISLLHLPYQWPSVTPNVLLTLKNLEDFIQCVEKSWKIFQDHREKGILQLEAFLIHTSLTSGHFDDSQSSEKKFTDILKNLRPHVSLVLKDMLNKYATTSPFDWVQMTRITGEVAKGDMSAAEEKEVEISELQEALIPLGSKTHEQEVVNLTQSREGILGSFSDVLNSMGIHKYYPSKISFMDAIVIRQVTGHPRLVDIPWVIIRKLLMADFNARDALLTAVEQSARSDSDSDDSFDRQSDCEEEVVHVNTLDALVAIFVCCDNFLRQTLAQRLFFCKLAIPFMYPLGSDGMLGMSLWALRTITIQWNTKGGNSTEVPVTDMDFPLVTFVRLGRPPLSKSKLMNDILCDKSHNTFFHHDCSNGTVPRRITDGLVECSWFISARGDHGLLPGTTLFLNLRGDASSLNKQMEILQEISSVVFVIVTAHDLVRQPITQACQRTIRTPKDRAILFLISNKQTKEELIAERSTCADALGQYYWKAVPKISSKTRNGIEKNTSEITKEVRKKLSKALVDSYSRNLERCAELAKKKGVIIDECKDEYCLNGKFFADKVIEHMAGKEIVECKTMLLPLQGALWFEYCKLLKVQHRTSGTNLQSSLAYLSEQAKQEMNRLRTKQVKLCSEGMSPFIKEFMLHLQKYADNQYMVMYFMKWLQILLDEKSRTNLPGLRKQYHRLWREFQKAKEKRDEGKVNNLKPQLNEAEHKLASASLGLEHLFRELGQLYEAVEEGENIGKDTRRVAGYLTDIAAQLLMKGTPLELVDGDTSSVPLSWVRAVLKKLEKIIGDKKLFVLSVLGIQSSGKSTVLNTMFGLQLAVTAGRCTRGAYMQLVPVDEGLVDYSLVGNDTVNNSSKLPFDYLVVVDTEGLRAPELGQLQHEHDNELATFVIGLGDVTILNIKGENTAEMNDILQIAVHAFLRMKLVSKHTQNHGTCIFVHQNVPAANADELLMYGFQRLKESLDKTTEDAALSENIADIKSFSQIINFDVLKHVWYVPDLWLGNPPMAPANPGYSERVNAVRLSLLTDIAKRQESFLTASDLSIRIADLWNGVLADDFVFSFRNGLEVMAYNSLQSAYYTLEWELQSALRAWLQTSEIKLNACDTRDDLDKCHQLLTVTLHEVLTSKAEDIKNRLTKYFETNNLREIVIQWQQSKLYQLQFAVEEQQNECKTDLLSIKEARQVDILQNQEWSQNESQIMNRAINLADELKGKEVTALELENKFDNLWMKMTNELRTSNAGTVLNMEVMMEDILNQSFPSHRKVVRDELGRHPLNIPLEVASLVGSITLKDLTNEHISLKGVYSKIKESIGCKDHSSKYETLILTDGIFEKVGKFLKDLSRQDMKFQKSHGVEVIKILVDSIDSYNKTAHVSTDCTFTILPEYEVKLAVHISRHCVQVFNQLQCEYNKKHGVIAKLEHYRNTAWTLFKNTVKQSTEEVIAGELLCTQLKDIVKGAVRKAIPMKCIDEVLRDFQMTKYYLIVKIMDDLACKGNFKEYEPYIENAQEFALKWITQYTNEKMFTKRDGSGMSRYAEISRIHIRKIVSCIAESVIHATDEIKRCENVGMVTWIDHFCRGVKNEIAVPVSSVNNVSSRQVVNFSNLQRVILDQIDGVVEDPCVDVFVAETQDTVSWDGIEPAQQILDRIWGCPEQCPFCHEPCADTTSGHYSSSKKAHMCVQHRPQGIGGVRWCDFYTIDGVNVNKDQLIHHTCNYTIQSGGRFFCSACKNKCRKYGKCTETEVNKTTHANREYKTYLEDWDIAPDRTNSVSKYWMWFMATYQTQLTDMHNAVLPDIPESWKSITKEDALNDLRQVHY